MARAVPRGLRRGYYAPVACCGGRALRLLKLREQVRALGLGCQDDSQAKLAAMREKTARLRALRLARDAANKKAPPADQKGAA